MDENAKAVLVAGASGFLGRHLCQRLKTEGARVTALDRKATTGPWEAFIEADLSKDALDPDSLEGFGTVYHLPGGELAGAACHQVIVGGTGRLLDAAQKADVPRFLYLSGVEAMGPGNPRDIPLKAMDETWPHTPQSPMGLAKAEAEERVRGSGLPHWVILRPAMLFGPGDIGDLPRIVEAVRRGRFPPIPETGHRCSMIHVDDVVEYLLRAALRPVAAGKCYILASSQAVSLRELYDAIRQSLSLPRESRLVPLWRLHCLAVAGGIFRRPPAFDQSMLRKLTHSSWYSPEQAVKDLGYTAKWDVRKWLAVGD